MRIKLDLLYVLVSVLIMSSCSTPKISYFQDVDDATQLALAVSGDIKFKTGDKITVVVNTKDQEYNNLYNLPYVPTRIGQTINYTQQSQGLSCYTVDDEGVIDFPILGKVKAEGMTRGQLADEVKRLLLDNRLLQDDPLVVTVEFANLTFSILGEVNGPGRYSLDKDKMTVLEAISMARDLTVMGERENVLVLRNENGKQVTYMLDLTSAQDLVNSPAFYLQQGDIIYVQPNKVRQRQSTVNGNNIRSTSFWISIASLLTSVALLIVNSVDLN